MPARCKAFKANSLAAHVAAIDDVPFASNSLAQKIFSPLRMDGHVKVQWKRGLPGVLTSSTEKVGLFFRQ